MELIDTYFGFLRKGQLFIHNKTICIKCLPIQDAGINTNYIKLDPYQPPNALYLPLKYTDRVQILELIPREGVEGDAQRTLIYLVREFQKRRYSDDQ